MLTRNTTFLSLGHLLNAAIHESSAPCCETFLFGPILRKPMRNASPYALHCCFALRYRDGDALRYRDSGFVILLFYID